MFDIKGITFARVVFSGCGYTELVTLRRAGENRILWFTTLVLSPCLSDRKWLQFYMAAKSRGLFESW